MEGVVEVCSSSRFTVGCCCCSGWGGGQVPVGVGLIGRGDHGQGLVVAGQSGEGGRGQDPFVVGLAGGGRYDRGMTGGTGGARKSGSIARDGPPIYIYSTILH